MSTAPVMKLPAALSPEMAPAPTVLLVAKSIAASRACWICWSSIGMGPVRMKS